MLQVGLKRLCRQVIPRGPKQLAGHPMRAIAKAKVLVDVSSPVNPILDTESPGQIVREADYALYPFEPLGSLIRQLALEDRGTDLIANLVHRAVDVIEQGDSVKRSSKRESLQSAIYSQCFGLFADGKYAIFQMYNRQVFSKVAPKVHASKLSDIKRLISQPLLRAIAFNRNLLVDPNQVMAAAGVDGFRTIMDMYSLDLRSLTGKNLDQLLNAMRSRRNQAAHFDLLRVWLSVWDESLGMKTPAVRGSKWSMETVLLEVIRKQSKHMLIRLMAEVGGTTRDELARVCRSRHSITGMLKHPWAHDVIDEWMIEQRLGLATDATVASPIARIQGNSSVQIVPEKDPGISLLGTASLPTGSRKRPVHVSEAFLISKDSDLTLVKDAIFGLCDDADSYVGLSFVTSSVLSISTPTASYVVDMTAVNSMFVSFLVRKILNAKNLIKIVYSLESFLTQVQTVLGVPNVHFENIVDLRRSRLRRTVTVAHHDEALDGAILPGVIDPVSSYTSSGPLVEKVEHFPGNSRLGAMVEDVLGCRHDRDIAFDESAWLIRPLSEELCLFAANDSHYLVQIELELRNNRNLLPSEVLTFDPFIHS